MLALPPQSLTGSCAHAKMGSGARSRCIACYYKQPHICSDSDPTLYSPDGISLTSLKLDDPAPVIREILDLGVEPEPQSTQRALPQSEPSLKSETPKSLFRSCLVPDRESSLRSEESKPRLGSCLSPGLESSVKSRTRRTRGRAPAFPLEWPETWEWHPTTPGLLWIWRSWTDGTTEYLLHHPNLNKTRRYWLPLGGDEFDFQRDPWTSAQIQRQSWMHPASPVGFRGLVSPAALSDSSGETVIGEAPGSHYSRGMSPKAEDRGLGIWEENTLQLMRHDDEKRRKRNGESERKDKEGRRRRREEEREEKRVFKEYKKRLEAREREKKEDRKRREAERKRRERLYMVRRGGKHVIVANGKHLRR